MILSKEEKSNLLQLLFNDDNKLGLTLSSNMSDFEFNELILEGLYEKCWYKPGDKWFTWKKKINNRIIILSYYHEPNEIDKYVHINIRDRYGQSHFTHFLLEDKRSIDKHKDLRNWINNILKS